MNSLEKFFLERIKNYLTEDSKILEIGCGDNSFFESLNYKNVTAIDKSIDKILNAKNSPINYVAMDIVRNDLNQKYNFIFDTHTIHCLTSSIERDLALKNVYELLEVDGIFASEMMIKKKASDPDNLFYGRNLKASFEVEAELINLNFKIIYFYIHPDLYFLDDVTLKNKCDVLQFIAKKMS